MSHLKYPPLLNMGFRPFFLGGALIALWGLAVWVSYLYFATPLVPSYGGGVFWHAHEMIYGFALAVDIGFLLTAVSSWTGRKTLDGWPLAGLFAVWLAGRVVPLCGLESWWPAALTDLLFLPLIMFVLGRGLKAGSNKRNYGIVGILMVFWLCNIFIHADLLGYSWAEGTLRKALMVAIDWHIILIAVIAGRVIPFFTTRALPEAKSCKYAIIEVGAIVTLVILTMVEHTNQGALLVLICAVLACLFHSLRFYFWYDKGIWTKPILLVLYIAYAWLIVGLVLKVAAYWDAYYGVMALHTWTVGAIGGMILGMMVRVGKGHTGRVIESSRLMNIAFVILNLSAIIRVFGQKMSPQNYLVFIAVAGVFWVLAFSLFFVEYLPILTQARPDGKDS